MAWIYSATCGSDISAYPGANTKSGYFATSVIRSPEIFISPRTTSFASGAELPIPTFPLLATVMQVLFFIPNIRVLL
ncbi:MAG: hypothetical protein A2014_10870 [Spirochaetes bacterium GWF1_49_6]|nr:MAG: hypothetical protein A2014_10870 [Spirochaetes bacterium GWF1_49_6]